MSRKYKFRGNDELYFTTQTIVHWIDVLTRTEYKNIILDSLKHCQEKKGLELYAWVIMTNHMHMVVGTNKNPLKDIMRDFKSYSSRKIREAIVANPKESRKEWMVSMLEHAGIMNPNNNDWQLWQQDNHPVHLYDGKITKQKVNYIHNNPVRAGFVAEPQHWIYSSAGDYLENRRGLIDINILDGLYHI